MKKIMFNDKYGLTNAVLNGTKTMTRRIIKGTGAKLGGSYSIVMTQHGYRFEYLSAPNSNLGNVCCAVEIKPTYEVGEVVSIAQSYKDAGYDEDIKVRCKGKWHTIGFTAGWENKMFVRADEMPHQIQITDVKVERLQDITDEDYRKEGIQKIEFGLCDFQGIRYLYDGMKGDITRHLTPRDAFHELICKLSGKNVWIDNPYVFVYTFKLIR